MKSDGWRGSAGGIELRVLPRGDRVGHAFYVMEEDAPQLLLESVEGTGDDDWPPSPPWQDWNVHEDEKRTAILSVGRSGKSHWSVCLETLHKPAVAGWKCDVACRIRTAGGFLGQTYRLGPEVQATVVGESCELAVGERIFRLEPQKGADVACEVCLRVDRLIIQPMQLALAAAPSTVRWLFQLIKMQ